LLREAYYKSKSAEGTRDLRAIVSCKYNGYLLTRSGWIDHNG
jgi:hypothetical protein